MDNSSKNKRPDTFTPYSEQTIYHVPALLTETIEGLNIKPNGVYVDATFGGGGHAKAILERLGTKGKLLGFDQDADAFDNRIDDKRFIFVRSNFRYLSNFLKYHNIRKIDGILADLGVSFHHFDDAERGFSFRFDSSKLDMRMNTSASLTAEKILNEYEEQQLADIFYHFGEMHNARRIATAIVQTRANKRIETTVQLLEVLEPFFSHAKKKKETAKAFQALRIEVNKEMQALEELLSQSVEWLNIGGRLAFLTYHSLEDRLVKNFIRSGNVHGKLEKDFFGNIISPLKTVNQKVIVASIEEMEKNPRARSAKLRIGEKTSSH